MPVDISEHLLASGTALVLHGEQRLTDGDLAQLSELSDIERSKITIAVLSDTPLTDVFFQHLAELPNLRELYLQGTSITDHAPFELCTHKLEVVNVDRTCFGDKAIGKLSLARELRVLSAKNTEVTNSGIYQLAKSKKLHEYHLSGTNVTKRGKILLDNALYRATFLSLARYFFHSLQISIRRLDNYLSLA